MTDNNGFFDALRRAAGTALAMGQSRLELASIELAEAGERLVSALLIGLFGVLLVTAALVSLSIWVGFLLWPALGPLALIILAAVYLLLGVVLLMRMRQRLRTQPPFLAATIFELRRDVSAMRGGTSVPVPAESER